MTPTCRCGSPSVVRVRLPLGCAAYPDVEQELCAQHLLSVEPVEPFEPLQIHAPRTYSLITGAPLERRHPL